MSVDLHRLGKLRRLTRPASERKLVAELWGDAVGPASDAEALARAQGRLVSLNEIVRRHGRPWREAVPVGEVAEAMPPDWYESFRP